MTMPITFNMLIDIFYCYDKNSLFQRKIPRFIMVSTLLVTDILILTEAVPRLDPVILFCFLVAKLVLLSYTASLFLKELIAPIWSFILLFGMVCSFVVVSIVSLLIGRDEIFYITFGTIGSLNAICMLFFLYKLTDLMSGKALSSEQWSSVIYLAFNFCLIIVTVAFLIVIQADVTLQSLTSCAYCQAALTLVLSVMENRFVNQVARSHKRTLDATQTFVRFMSHEIRTPLNTVCLGLTLLRDDMASPDVASVRKLQRTVDDLHYSCESALTTLTDFLEYERFGAGLMNLNISTFSAWSFIFNTVSPLMTMARYAQVTLRFADEVSRMERMLSDVELEADEYKLKQALHNVIVIALKFTPIGGTVSVGIRLEAELEPSVCSRLEIEVADTGVGISPEEQSRLFQEAVQFEPGTLNSSTGLGLWVSREIIDMHAGTLSIHSELEQNRTGNLFVISLSTVVAQRKRASLSDVAYNFLHQDERSRESSACSARVGVLPENSDCSAAAAPRRFSSVFERDGDSEDSEDKASDKPLVLAKKRSERQGLASASDARLLLVQECEDTRRTMTLLLRSRVDAVVEASSGYEALKTIAQMMDGLSLPFDILLIDFDMSELDGAATVEGIRALGCTSVPIIGIMQKALSETEVSELELAAVLTKPLDLRELDGILKNVCQAQ